MDPSYLTAREPLGWHALKTAIGDSPLNQSVLFENENGGTATGNVNTSANPVNRAYYSHFQGYSLT